MSPGVTEGGTVVYSFPALMRTRRPQGGPLGGAPAPTRLQEARPVLRQQAADERLDPVLQRLQPRVRILVPDVSVTQGTAALAKTGPYLYAYLGKVLQSIGILNPVPFIGIVLGVHPGSVLHCVLPGPPAPFAPPSQVERGHQGRNAAAEDPRADTRQPAHVDASEIQGHRDGAGPEESSGRRAPHDRPSGCRLEGRADLAGEGRASSRTGLPR